MLALQSPGSFGNSSEDCSCYHYHTIPSRNPNSMPKPKQVFVTGPAIKPPTLVGLMLTLLQSKEKSRFPSQTVQRLHCRLLNLMAHRENSRNDEGALLGVTPMQRYKGMLPTGKSGGKLETTSKQTSDGPKPDPSN